MVRLSRFDGWQAASLCPSWNTPSSALLQFNCSGQEGQRLGEEGELRLLKRDDGVNERYKEQASMSERGKNQIPTCLICGHIIILILGLVRLPDTPRAQQVMRLCELCGLKKIESAGAFNRCMAQSSSQEREGGGNKQMHLIIAARASAVLWVTHHSPHRFNCFF